MTKIQVKYIIPSSSILTYNNYCAELVQFNHNEFIREFDTNIEYTNPSKVIIEFQKSYSDQIRKYYLILRDLCYKDLGEYVDIDIEYKIIGDNNANPSST